MTTGEGQPGEQSGRGWSPWQPGYLTTEGFVLGPSWGLSWDKHVDTMSNETQPSRSVTQTRVPAGSPLGMCATSGSLGSRVLLVQWHVRCAYREDHAPSRSTHSTFPGCSNPGSQRSLTQLGDCRGRELRQIRAQTCTAANSQRVGAETGHTPEPGPKQLSPESSWPPSRGDSTGKPGLSWRRHRLVQERTREIPELNEWLVPLSEFAFRCQLGSLRPATQLYFGHSFLLCSYCPKPLGGDPASRSQNLSLLGAGHCDGRITSTISFTLHTALRSTCCHDPRVTDEKHEAEQSLKSFA